MSLQNYFEVTFQMMQHHNYSLTEMEGLIPWERDIYLSQLIEYIEIENERIQLEMLESKRNHTNKSPF
jgi:hypothetical protein